MKKINKILIAVFAIVLLGVSSFLGFFILNTYVNNKNFDQNELIKNETPNINDEKKESQLAVNNLEFPITNNILSGIEPKINSETIIAFEYYYKGDEKTERTEESPPYFLINMTESELQKNYDDWDIVQFNADEIIMRKTIEGKTTPYFIVGEHDGYIAVFYENSSSGVNLKEITDTPINSLSVDEQTRLKLGIEVAGENELIRLLQDYGS